MATVVRSIRAPAPLWALLDAAAAKMGDSANGLACTILLGGLAEYEEESAPAPAPKAQRKAPMGKGAKAKGPAKTVAPRPPPEVKAGAAKQALAQAEARTGVKSVMDSLPVGQSRPPMLRKRDIAGQGKG